LHPGATILPHCGPSNARLRLHLPIALSPGATIRVGGEARRAWAEGEPLVLDDSFEHDVRHRGDAPRVLLILDFWHPELRGEEKDYSRFGVL